MGKRKQLSLYLYRFVSFQSTSLTTYCQNSIGRVKIITLVWNKVNNPRLLGRWTLFSPRHLPAQARLNASQPLGGLDHRGGSRMPFVPFLQMLSWAGGGLVTRQPFRPPCEWRPPQNSGESVKRGSLKSKPGLGACQWCVHHLVASRNVGSAGLGGMGMRSGHTGPEAQNVSEACEAVVKWGDWGVTVLGEIMW